MRAYCDEGVKQTCGLSQSSLNMSQTSLTKCQALKYYIPPQLLSLLFQQKSNHIKILQVFMACINVRTEMERHKNIFVLNIIITLHFRNDGFILFLDQKGKLQLGLRMFRINVVYFPYRKFLW